MDGPNGIYPNKKTLLFASMGFTVDGSSAGVCRAPLINRTGRSIVVSSVGKSTVQQLKQQLQLLQLLLLHLLLSERRTTVDLRVSFIDHVVQLNV